LSRKFAFLILVALAVPVFAADRFPALMEVHKNPRLAAEAATVSGATFTVGHMKIDLASGSASSIFAGSDRVGIFFKGKGSFRYETVEATELPIVSYNVRKASDQKYEGDASHGVVTGSFDELLLWSSNAPLPELSGTGGTSVAPAYGEHRERFGRNRDTPLAHGMVLQKLAFPAKKFVQAEMAGGGDDLIYRYDEAENADESLQKLRSLSGAPDSTIKRWFLPVTLSLQPIGRDHRAVRPAPYLLTAVDFTLLADGDNAKLTVTETIKRGAGQGALRFGMNDIDFAKMGVAPRHFTINSIKDESGKSVPFDHENESLMVGVEGVAGEVLKLTFDISGDFLIRSGGDNAWQLGVDEWFPQPDLGGQFYTVHSLVKVKKPFIAFTPGKVVKRGVEGEYNVLETTIENPVQFEVVHAGKYDFTEETRGGVTIRVASYAGKNERAAKQLTNLAFSLIEYYEHFLGPFPFPEFNIIQVNSFGYGQAPPGTMFITNEAFDSMVGEVNKFFSEGINERFAHEIAHQYWGHTIKMPSGEEQWLTESFAEYSAALALKKYKGKAVYDRLVAVWKQRAQDSTKVAPIPYANRIAGDPMTAFQSRFGLLYAKGPYVLYTLHKELGDDQFLTFLKSYQKSRRWKFSSTAEAASLLQFITKKDYLPFFEKYFWGTAMPD